MNGWPPPDDMNSFPSRRFMGFALVDMVTLLSVLVILAALVLVPMENARRRSNLSACQENLRVVTKAVISFSNDHAQTLPAPQEGMGELQWWYKEQVKSHAGLQGPSSAADRVFACPEDRGYTDPQPFHQTARFDYGSYCFNGVTIPGVPSIAGWQVGSIADPKKTLLMMEWTAHGPLSWHRSRTGKRNAPFYRDAESVVGFVDGRVALIPIYYDGFNAAYTRDPIGGYGYRYSGR
jgi:type II secretory pathway pseudopilin PulG